MWSDAVCSLSPWVIVLNNHDFNTDQTNGDYDFNSTLPCCPSSAGRLLLLDCCVLFRPHLPSDQVFSIMRECKSAEGFSETQTQNSDVMSKYKYKYKWVLL